MNIILAKNICYDVSTPDGKLNLLNNISFEIKAGETVAIIGRSGAGKTTLLNVLAGFITATGGELRILGEDFVNKSEVDRAKFRGLGIGFIFQDFFLLNNMTVIENVMLGLNIHKIKNSLIKARDMLKTFGLGDKENMYPYLLSQGEQQRVAIARALVLEPKILFADEPTGNLDEETGDLIMQDIFDMIREKNKNLILITHDLELASKCSRIIKMHKGKMIDE